MSQIISNRTTIVAKGSADGLSTAQNAVTIYTPTVSGLLYRVSLNLFVETVGTAGTFSGFIIVNNTGVNSLGYAQMAGIAVTALNGNGSVAIGRNTTSPIKLTTTLNSVTGAFTYGYDYLVEVIN